MNVTKVQCPACNSNIVVEGVPVKGPPTNDEWWTCLWCDEVVCVDCWHKHTEKAHKKRVKGKR